MWVNKPYVATLNRYKIKMTENSYRHISWGILYKVLHLRDHSDRYKLNWNSTEGPVLLDSKEIGIPAMVREAWR